MKYSDIIAQQKAFKYSINLKYDMHQTDKFNKYIITEENTNIFEQIFNDIISENPKNSSKLIYGAYGTGKSYFITILATILGKLFTKEEYEIFNTRLSKINNKL